MKEIWSVKHRPKTIEDYVFQNERYQVNFSRMIQEKQIPHLLLSGVQGTGKSTIARILIDNMNVDPDLDVKIIDGSKQNSVDDMRNEIMDFIHSYPMGDFKIVLIEEGDFLSLNAQAVLRTPLEDPEITARFIITCNYDHKIMPAIKSRCDHYHFKSPSHDEVVMYIAKILVKEEVQFDLDTLEQYVIKHYPDIRKTVIEVQSNVRDGKLQNCASENTTNDYRLQLLDLLNADDWEGARRVVCKNVSPGEWEDLYRFLYDNLHLVSKFKTRDKHDQAIIVIADHLYKHTICSDSEINAAAMFIKLATI